MIADHSTILRAHRSHADSCTSTEFLMKIEHTAFNVEDPVMMARWYVEHLGLTVRRRTTDAPYAHFLADDSGTVMIEIYGNKEQPLPNYRNMNPAQS